MIKLKVDRLYKLPEYTIGKLYIDGKYFCDTLEDTDRGLRQDMTLGEIKAIKVPKQTAIPIGTYKVIVNMSPSKKRLLPRLLNVPGYEGILIHRGNDKDHTDGCILVGENKVKGKVINSTSYELLLVSLLSDEKEIEITIG